MGSVFLNPDGATRRGGTAVINATTHTGAERALRDQTIAIRRIGPRTFGALIGAELLLITGVLIWALFAPLPAMTPLAAATDLTPVVQAIRDRIGGTVVDPLITIAPGTSARASNVRGFSLDGTIYYYYIEGAQNFDPLSRGLLSHAEVEVLLRDDSGPRTFVIYRVF